MEYHLTVTETDDHPANEPVPGVFFWFFFFDELDEPIMHEMPTGGRAEAAAKKSNARPKALTR